MAVEYGNGRIVTSGLVLSLDAADRNSYPGSGTTWFDTSGNGRNYTLVGSPTFNSANGGSILFGSNQYCNGPASNSFGISQNVTIEIVIRINSLLSGTNTQWGFFFDGVSVNRGISCHINEGPGTTYFDTMGFNTDNGNRISATAPSNGTINHFVFRYRDTTTPRKNIFRNGSSIANSGANTPTSLNLSSAANEVGISMDGNIYLFRIYNTDLSDAQILQNYNATKSRFGL